MDGAEKVVSAYGDRKRLTFVRSTLKPLQAIPLIESGAASTYHLSNAEIAVACGSHSGEDIHGETVSNWLSRLGLDQTALECGAQRPAGLPDMPAQNICNNCSGKHAGMLTLALYLKAPVVGYTDINHPVQKMILSAISEMCGGDLTPAVCGIDGCSAPNPAMPLENLARGFARFMNAESQGFVRGTSCRHIFQAMIEHPMMVGGLKRLDPVLMEAAKGKNLAKTGAEGTYIAVIPEKDRVIALKCEDGAKRAGEAALYALLAEHQLVEDSVLQSIQNLTLPVIRNWRGIETGITR